MGDVVSRLVFSAAISGNGTIYTPESLNRALGSCERIFIQARATEVSGSSPSLSIGVEHTANGVDWSTRSFPISASPLTVNGTTIVFGMDPATVRTSAPLARLAITLLGTNPAAQLEVTVAPHRGVGWTPAALGTKLRLWLQANEISSSPVSEWPNVGLGGGAYTATGAVRPAAGVLAGVSPVPDFDGADALTGGPTLGSVITGSAYHGFAVVRFDTISYTNASSGYDAPAVIADAGGFFALNVRDSTGGGAYRVDAYHWDTGIKAASQPISLSTDTLVEWRYDGSSIFVRVGAAAESAGTAAGSVGATGNLTLVGARYDAQIGIDGKVGELILANAALNADERTSVRQYLAAKFRGLSV